MIRDTVNCKKGKKKSQHYTAIYKYGVEGIRKKRLI